MDSTVFAKDKRISRAAIVYYAIAGIITLLALALRFAYLTLRPLHHDEGVNGWFLTNLFREGIYKYDPANYHGPTLYYIALVFVQAFGLNTFTIRASVAVWGVFIVLAAYWLRPYFSSKATHLTAFFLATSPGLVFISRYFIHETFFVFLSFAALIVILQYIRRQSAGAIATIAFSAILFIALLIPLMKLANASLPD
ncbi:MAG: phospholipid carrier-dependent glycosyltransferase, partial [Pyrinomonadaceae bacterium]